MAITTVYTCDHCGTEVPKDGRGLFEVKVTARMIWPTVISTNTDCMPSQQWCRDCLNGSALLGITDTMLEERRQRELAPPVPATLEDMIREIAYEAGSEGAIQAINNR